MKIALALCLTFAISACSMADPYADAKEAVRRSLNDPDSAQFRNVGPCAGNSKIITGQVNAKNGFGGYVGYKDFYVENRLAVYEGEYEQIEIKGQHYSPYWAAVKACIIGGPANIASYVSGVENGASLSMEELLKLLDDRNARLKGSPK